MKYSKENKIKKGATEICARKRYLCSFGNMKTQFFKRKEKGYCPTYHAPDGLMYWVQDHKVNHFNGGGEYEYSLMCRKKDFCENMSNAQFKKFVKKFSLIYVENCCGIDIFKSRGRSGERYCYNVHDKVLKIVYGDQMIKGDFQSYKDCIEYAEKYVKEKYLYELVQLSLFDMEGVNTP